MSQHKSPWFCSQSQLLTTYCKAEKLYIRQYWVASYTFHTNKIYKSITEDLECCQCFKISKYLSLKRPRKLFPSISLNLTPKSECCHDGETISGREYPEWNVICALKKSNFVVLRTGIIRVSLDLTSPWYFEELVMIK